MGHATHFLERMERLEQVEVEAALQLYRSPELLRFVLGEAGVPDAAERIAIELRQGGDAEAGPFAVVTRDGAFVTVLGRGMNPRGLHVVPHATWDRLKRRFTRLGDIYARAQDALSDSALFRTVFKRMVADGPYWSREHFREARSVAPLMLAGLYRGLADHHAYVRTLESRLTRVALKLERTGKTKVDDEVGREFGHLWQSVWAMSHLDVLVSDCDTELATASGQSTFIDRILDSTDVDIRSFMRCYTRWGPLGVLVRGAWVAGRRAHVLLPWLKDELRKPGDYVYVKVAYAMGLAAIAFRHKRFAAEARKALASRAPLISADEVAKQLEVKPRDHVKIAVALAGFRATADLEFANPAGIRKILAKNWREGVLNPYMRPSGPETLPEPTDADLVSMAASNVFTALDLESLWAGLIGLSLVAPADAEALFPVAGQAPDFRMRHGPSLALAMLLAREKVCFTSLNLPVQREGARVGRNEPCPCGSGKKHKRCCGANGPNDDAP